QANLHGIMGHSAIVRDTLEPKDVTGFGQHGGLGAHEQSPFLFASGGGFVAGGYTGRSSLIDIAPTVLRHLGLAAEGTDGHALPRRP
ncbi:MAG TPA: nucleotide pyrophosphatase, partial [Stellaceae bacterium]